MADHQKILENTRAEIIAKISEYNLARKENDAKKFESIERELKDLESGYADAKRMEVFCALANTEDPVKAAITRRSYTVVSHKANRENGIITDFEVSEHKEVEIDLAKFFVYLKKPDSWKYTVEKFNQLLALRTATELKLSTKRIKEISDSFYMSDNARKIELGETPTSNTAICKQLQKIFDEILFEDDGKGKNKYKVNSHDVAYLLFCYTKRGKKPLSIAVAKHSQLRSLVLGVMHRVVTGKVYDLEFKMVPAQTADARTPETKPAQENTKKAEVAKKSA